MGPLRTGFRYGIVAVVVALVADLRFLFVDPVATPDWILTVIENFRTQLALAALLFLGILAALRVRPVRVDDGVPYRSVLLRDCTLAATVVALMAGFTLLLLTALNATLFADDLRAYARDAAPSMIAYYEKVAGRMEDPPTLPTLEQVQAGLQPPAVRDLGRSVANLVLRAILIGALGALVGALRGSFGRGPNPAADAPPEKGSGETPGGG